MGKSFPRRCVCFRIFRILGKTDRIDTILRVSTNRIENTEPWAKVSSPRGEEVDEFSCRNRRNVPVTHKASLMISGLYSSATAIDVATSKHDVIAQNLAHLSVPGYRKSVIVNTTFEAALDDDQQSEYARSALGTGTGRVRKDFTQGPIQSTGNRLDVALIGEGFFTVKGEQGPLYTRNGTFQVNGDGTLVTAEGLEVQGTQGPIQVPPESSVSDMTITRTGEVLFGEVSVGQLALVQFVEPERLIVEGATLFSAPGDLLPEPAVAQVQQGAREGANVEPMHELVNMITAMRQYEAAQRSMSSLASVVERHIDLQ